MESMMRSQRLWIIVSAVAVLVVIGIFAVQHFLDADTYRPRIQAALSTSLGRPVQLGHLSFSLFSGKLVAETASIADDPAFSGGPFLTAKDIRIGVETGALLFHHEIHVTGLTIDKPAIRLIRNQSGTWNYSSLGGDSKRKAGAPDNDLLPDLTVARMEIKGGTLTLGRLPADSKPHVYTDLDVTAQNFSFASAFPFTVSAKLPGGGTLNITGNAGPINRRDASLSPLTAQVTLKHADLVEAGFVVPAQGISGLADLDAKIASNGRAANADGHLHLTSLTLAKGGSPSSQPVHVQFSVQHNLQALSGKVSNAKLQIGHGALDLTGTYTTAGNTTSTQLHVSGQSMPIDDLVGFLPSLGVQLPAGSHLQGGTLSTSLDVTGPVNAPNISGPVRVSNTQLAGFNLGAKLASFQSLAGARTGANTTIQTLSTDLRRGPDGTHTDNIAAVVPGLGSASGSGFISVAGGLDYHLLVKLDSTGTGGIANQALSMLPGALGSMAGSASKNGIPLTITGTTANPVFTPDVGKMLGGAVQKNTQQSKPLDKVLGGLFGR
jgi:AsmA protein